MLLNTLLSGETVWYPILFDSPMNVARSLGIWLTVALVLAFVVLMLLFKGEKRTKFLKISAIIAIMYACFLAILYLTLTFLEDGIKPILFLPLTALLLTVAASAVILAFKRNKAIFIALACAVGVALVATLVCMAIHFSSGDAALDNWIVDENGSPDNSQVNSPLLYVCATVLILLVVASAFLLGRKDRGGFDAKCISYAAVCIAMSFALSYLRIVKMPQGGSITIASLLPLMIYSYMFGTKKGVFAGMIYGIMQALQDNYILHPAQFLLDYPVAFACIGLAGAFARVKRLEKLPQAQFAIGGVIAGLARFVAHFLSGIFAFGAFAPADTPVWLYSLGYQAGYVLPDIAIAIAVGILVFSSPTFAKQVRKFHAADTAPAEETATAEEA